MDVFGIAVSESGDYLRAAAIAAACDLGLFAQLAAPHTLAELAAALGVAPRRLRALVDVLAAIGAVERTGDRVVARAVPARPDIPPDGWGRLAEVIRRDRPLDVEGGEIERRYHRHLARAGAEPARELMQLLARVGRDGAVAARDAADRSAGAGELPDAADRPADADAVRDAMAKPRSHGDAGCGPSLLDIGGGAGAYTRAFLDANPAGRATLVDFYDVLALAREELGPLATRVTFVGGDARVAPVGIGHDVALLANVLHLHGEVIARELVAAAVRAARMVVIKDLEVAGDRSGPLAGLLFALNMAVFTAAGDVYPPSQLRAWLADAGAIAIAEHRLAAAPDAVVLIAWRA